MSACNDTRFEKMLAEYELDLLTSVDREAFELHLLECDSCYQEVSEFARESLHLLHSDRLKAIVRQAVGEQDDSSQDTDPAKASRRRRLITLVPVAAAAALVFLVLKPWQIEIRPTEEAVASENRLAVLPFSNQVDEKDSSLTGMAATKLLITDLSDSRTVAIVSNQQMEDILSTIATAEAPLKPEVLAATVANESKSKWVFTGTIVRELPQLTIDVLLLDAVNEDTLTHERVSCEPDANIFCVVDSITTTIRQRLQPLLDSVGTDRPVAEITTYSPEAYLLYAQGVNQYRKFFFDQARVSFNKATHLDSTFAMAWYYLALVDDRSNIDHAVRHLENASQREQYWISSRAALWEGDTAKFFAQFNQLVKDYPDEEEAYYWLGIVENGRGNLEAAEQYFYQALKVNPRHKLSWNSLAYLYSRMGDYEQAISAIDKYAHLAPKEPNPYDSRGDIQVNFGKFDLAIESYRKAVDIRPDFAQTAMKLANLLLLDAQFEEAEQWSGGCSTPIRDLPSPCVVKLTSLLVSKGLLDSAYRYADNRLEELWTDYEGDDQAEIAQVLMFQKALIRAETDLTSAWHEIRKAYKPKGKSVQTGRVDLLHYELLFLAASDNRDEIKPVLDKLKEGAAKNPGKAVVLHFAQACIALEEGTVDSAVAILEKISRSEPYDTDFLAAFMLSRAYVEAGRMKEAVTLLNSLMISHVEARVLLPTLNVRLHYYLGVAYEASNWPERAREQYERFLEFWGNSDTELPIVNEVRQRLARMTS